MNRLPRGDLPSNSMRCGFENRLQWGDLVFNRSIAGFVRRVSWVAESFKRHRRYRITARRRVVPVESDVLSGWDRQVRWHADSDDFERAAMAQLGRTD